MTAVDQADSTGTAAQPVRDYGSDRKTRDQTVDTATGVSDQTMPHRLGDVRLTVLGPDGLPAADSVVTVEQRRHAFAFGNIGFDLVPLIGGPGPDGAAERVDSASPVDLDHFADL